MIRDVFLRRHIVPRQSLSDFTHIRKLTIGKVVIQRLPERWQEINAFADSLNMPRTSQGVPAVTQSALLYFLRPKRMRSAGAQTFWSATTSYRFL